MSSSNDLRRGCFSWWSVSLQSENLAVQRTCKVKRPGAKDAPSVHLVTSEAEG